MPEPMTVTGVPQMIKTLNGMQRRVQKKVLSQALRSAMRPLLAAAKRNARTRGAKETRLEKQARKEGGGVRLFETIGAVSRTYAGSRMIVAGPRAGRKFGFKGNVGHLVERGHKKVLWGKPTGGTVRGYPFMKPAWDANVGRARSILIEKIKSGLEREAKAARVK